MPIKWSRQEERAIEKMRRDYVRNHRPGAKERSKKSKAAIEALNKRFGPGAIGPIIADSLSVPCVSTLNAVMDDWLTGSTVSNEDGKPETVAGSGRGLPKGRIVEIYGAESCGKTTWCLEMIAAYQRQGLNCAFVDAEHALNLEYAAHLGVDLEEWLLSQPSSGEEALDVVLALTKTDALDLIVVDSVAALVPLAEQDKNADESTVALQARMMSAFLRKVTAVLGKSGTTIVFVNQTREKINTGFGGGFGPSITTPAGKALKFYASVRIAMQNVGRMKKGATSIGQRSRLRTVKNKVATPFRECFVEILFGEGIQKVLTKMKR